MHSLASKIQQKEKKFASTEAQEYQKLKVVRKTVIIPLSAGPLSCKILVLNKIVLTFCLQKKLSSKK